MVRLGSSAAGWYASHGSSWRETGSHDPKIALRRTAKPSHDHSSDDSTGRHRISCDDLQARVGGGGGRREAGNLSGRHQGRSETTGKGSGPRPGAEDVPRGRQDSCGLASRRNLREHGRRASAIARGNGHVRGERDRRRPPRLRSVAPTAGDGQSGAGQAAHGERCRRGALGAFQRFSRPDRACSQPSRLNIEVSDAQARKDRQPQQLCIL